MGRKEGGAPGCGSGDFWSTQQRPALGHWPEGWACSPRWMTTEGRHRAAEAYVTLRARAPSAGSIIAMWGQEVAPRWFLCTHSGFINLREVVSGTRNSLESVTILTLIVLLCCVLSAASSCHHLPVYIFFSIYFIFFFFLHLFSKLPTHQLQYVRERVPT